MKRYRYCPLCAAELKERTAGGRVRQACACGYVYWGNPVPAGAVCVLRGDRLLWVRRADEPRKGAWSLPSGFQEYDEDIRDCARREALEETGLAVEIGDLLGVYSVFDDPRNHALLAVYLARCDEGEPVAGDDAAEAAWFPVDDPPEPIAWDCQRRALADLADRLRREG